MLAQEQTEGPFYLDLDRVRSDITEGAAGTPLRLRVRVIDAACTPVPDAAVDVWHADAGGAYSGVGGDPTTFLRGTQITGAAGEAEFRTVYPGWYPGRTVHVHLKVFLGAQEAYTGQLYFNDALTDEVHRAAPYAARGEGDVRNADDALFTGRGSGSTLLAVTRAADGYLGTVDLGIPRA